MNQPMLIEHRTSEEPLSAHQTLIRPLQSVELPHVVIQIRTNGEPPLASFDSALEGLHSLMEPQMLPQVTGLRVRFATDVTEIVPAPAAADGSAFCSSSCNHSLLPLLRVVLLVMLAVLCARIKHGTADFAAQQKDLIKVRVSGKVVVLLVPAFIVINGYNYFLIKRIKDSPVAAQIVQRRERLKAHVAHEIRLKWNLLKLCGQWKGFILHLLVAERTLLLPMLLNVLLGCGINLTCSANVSQLRIMSRFVLQQVLLPCKEIIAEFALEDAFQDDSVHFRGILVSKGRIGVSLFLKEDDFRG